MKRNQLIWNYYCCVKNSFKSIRIFPIWFYFHWYVYRIIWWKLSEDNSIFSFFISPISLCHNLKCLGKDLLLQDQDSVDNFPRPRRLLASGGRVLLNEIEEMEEILKLKTRMIVLQSKSYWILSNIGKISQKIVDIEIILGNYYSLLLGTLRPWYKNFLIPETRLVQDC